MRPHGDPLPTPPGHPPGPQAASRPAWATPQPPRRLGAPSSTLVQVESQHRAPAHMGALRDGAAARRASGAWGRCKAARGCGIGEWGWWGDWGACWGLVGVRTAHLAPISCRGGVAATSCEKAVHLRVRSHEGKVGVGVAKDTWDSGRGGPPRGRTRPEWGSAPPVGTGGAPHLRLDRPE